MGFFDKKYCDICGEKIGLLGNRKLEDGNLCKNCAAKLSPWFSERRHSSISEIADQLKYREENKAAVQSFKAYETIGESYNKIMIDTSARQFTVADSSSMKNGNPDIVNCSQVRGVESDVSEHKTELKTKDSEGKMVSYNPPRYEYSYDIYCTIRVDHPYFDDMRFKLNDSTIKLSETPVTGNSGLFNNVIQQQKELKTRRYYDMIDNIKNLLMSTEVIEKQAENTSEAPASEPATAAAPQSDAWVCGYCRTQNPGGNFCSGCGAPRE